MTEDQLRDSMAKVAPRENAACSSIGLDSFQAIKQRAKHDHYEKPMGGQQERVMRLMQDGRERTMNDIANALQIRRETAVRSVSVLVTKKQLVSRRVYACCESFRVFRLA